MARSWEYSRGRRRAMQVIMWLIFGCTLGLAGLVSHQKNAAQQITLESQPRHIGDLLIHVPVGWEATRSSREGKVFLRMTEPAADARLRRRVQIWQEPLDDGSQRSAEAYLKEETKSRQLDFERERFHFGSLGDGVFAMAPPAEPDEAEDAQPQAPALFACVIVPPSHRAAAPIAVVIQMVGLPDFGPAERELMQQIAKGIVLAPGTGTAAGPSFWTVSPVSAGVAGQPR